MASKSEKRLRDQLRQARKETEFWRAEAARLEQFVALAEKRYLTMRRWAKAWKELATRWYRTTPRGILR